VRLEALLRSAGLNDPVEGGGPEVGRVVHDSRVVVTGDLFCCVPGDTYDGHDFAEGAVTAGAVAVLAERTLDLPVPVVIVNSVRRAMPHLVAAAERWPSRELDLVGVTGTNGKTSVVHLLDAVLERAGRTTATHGTLSGGRTTPEATDLQPLLRSWVATGVDAAAIEVSSHALWQHRVDGTTFAAVGFTNLSRDHLDYHESMDGYEAAKARLFNGTFADHAVVVVTDQAGRRMANRAREAAMTVVEGLATARPIPGRFELVPLEDGPQVVVDYAHTPDALTHVLATAREVTTGRVVVVFGCGGNRDRGKRPEMGRVAEDGADQVVVTSDNPRGEPPEGVIADILTGMERPPTLVEPDRRRAIAGALGLASRTDLVLLAGRGHEAVQELGDEMISFDDRIVAREEWDVLAVDRGDG
jgi:UDP-N-acetylmuramoyl-L-alanyl-D-glutamate--2,6-diaminopimelate ligase